MKNTLSVALFLFSHSLFAGAPAVVVSCSAKFAGLPNDSINVTFDKASSNFKVLWVNAKKETKELGTVKKFNDEKFEIQCMDAKAAAEIKKGLSDSEGIHDFLKVPQNKGALCYFVDETMTKCWSFDEKKKVFVDAGGWQT